MIIRRELPSDFEAVEAVTFAAFETMKIPEHPHTNEHILVKLLREDSEFVPDLDLVVELDGEIVGNIMYSRCGILRPNGAETQAIVFGPLSVKPELHGRGFGSALVSKSLEIAKEMQFGAVLITGHEDYYKRFGFVPASLFNITMPNGDSFDAFMALELSVGYLGTQGGAWRLCKAFDILEEMDNR